MKVVQSVHGKFHHFDLARQLHQRGMLEAIFTGYPRWKLRGEQLPPEKVRTYPWIMTPLMAKWHLGIVNNRLDRELAWLAAEALDSHVARNLPECDVFIGLSTAGLRAGRAIRDRGGSYVCDRGSAHIRYVERLLRDEFQRWGQIFPGIDSRIIAKEESEYGASDAITLPSRFSVRSFEEMGVPPEKVKKIPYGVDLTRFNKEGDPPRDSFEVLFVGNVSFQKGLPDLLHAFDALRHSRKRLRVVGAMQPEMEVYLREHSVAHVEFAGPVPQPELVSIMSTSHVLVLPSIQDGFGMVLAQAMACGCPIICSTNTGGEDLLGNASAGFVLPIRDIATLSAKLEMLCQDDHLRSEMGEAAMRRVRELGGWDSYGRAYSELCQELTSPDNPP